MSTISINTKAPDFELDSYDGKKVRLSDYYGNKNILLVFNRGFT